jgi:hypothetical protein
MIYRLTWQLSLFSMVLFLAAQSSAVAQENDEALATRPLPLSNSNSYDYTPQPLTIVQQRAKFEADQRTLRMNWNNWIGYSPSRPNMNASYMSNGMQTFYIPSRGVIVTASRPRSWYW